ncbi:hypothetical protein PENSPDRAFT_402015 [Peniophora sp. CONT]|nr:hypothetical protein PENSPDRAFT_402015 [Peniophora sp. CONT]
MPMRTYVLDDIPVIPAEHRIVEERRVSGFSGSAVSARSKAHPASPSTCSDALSPSPPRAAGKRRIQEFQETNSPPQPVRPLKRVRVDDADVRGQSPMTPERPTSETKAAGGSRTSEDSHFSLDGALDFGTSPETSPVDKVVAGWTPKVDLRKLARRAGHASGRLARTVLSPFKTKSTKLGNVELARLHGLADHPGHKDHLVQEQTLSETEPGPVAKATTPPPAIASSPLALSHLHFPRTTPPGQMSPRSDASRAPAPAWTSPVRFHAEVALPREVEGVLAVLEDVSIRDVCAHEHGKMHRGSMLTLGMRTGARV